MEMYSMNSNFNNTSRAELNAVLGNPQTISTAEGVIDVQYDADLERIVNVVSPTYAYLKQVGCETSVDSPKVGYRLKERKTEASFIGEAAELPAHDPSLFTRKSATITTIAYPIEISDIVAKDTENIDVVRDEINDGMADISKVKDDAILQGDNSTNANQFDGFTTLFTSNVTDLQNAQISLEDLDVLAQSMMDEGGSPSAVFTSAAVGRRLKDLIFAKTIYSYASAQDLGFNAVAYVTPEGTRIPIIIDYNLKSSADGDQLIMVDKDTIRIKEYQPAYVQPLAKTKLTTSLVLANTMTMYCRSEQKNGYLYNINPEVE
jgi:hypothetical protein